MKSIRIIAGGGVDQLRLVEVPTPSPGAGEVLIRVRVAGVNFADTMQRRDAYFIPMTFPHAPGVEVAGTVEAVGEGVDLARGTRVAGLCPNGGGYAEYAVVGMADLARLPEGLGFEAATAVLNQGLTAQGLIESTPELSRGASLLVTAAGGGVGGMLIQLARFAGAGQVLAAAGGQSKLDLALSMGADAAFDYTGDDWVDRVRQVTRPGVRVVMDAVGGAVRAQACRTLGSRGRLVFYGAASGATGIDDALLTQVLARGLSLTGYAIHTSIREDPSWLTRSLDQLFDLAVQGRLKTPLGPSFALADAAAAHTAIEARGTTGKVLLRID